MDKAASACGHSSSEPSKTLLLQVQYFQQQHYQAFTIFADLMAKLEPILKEQAFEVVVLPMQRGSSTAQVWVGLKRNIDQKFNAALEAFIKSRPPLQQLLYEGGAQLQALEQQAEDYKIEYIKDNAEKGEELQKFTARFEPYRSQLYNLHANPQDLLNSQLFSIGERSFFSQHAIQFRQLIVDTLVEMRKMLQQESAAAWFVQWINQYPLSQSPGSSGKSLVSAIPKNQDYSDYMLKKLQLCLLQNAYFEQSAFTTLGISKVQAFVAHSHGQEFQWLKQLLDFLSEQCPGFLDQQWIEKIDTDIGSTERFTSAREKFKKLEQLLNTSLLIEAKESRSLASPTHPMIQENSTVPVKNALLVDLPADERVEQALSRLCPSPEAQAEIRDFLQVTESGFVAVKVTEALHKACAAWIRKKLAGLDVDSIAYSNIAEDYERIRRDSEPGMQQANMVRYALSLLSAEFGFEPVVRSTDLDSRSSSVLSEGLSEGDRQDYENLSQKVSQAQVALQAEALDVPALSQIATDFLGVLTAFENKARAVAAKQAQRYQDNPDLLMKIQNKQRTRLERINQLIIKSQGIKPEIGFGEVKAVWTHMAAELQTLMTSIPRSTAAPFMSPEINVADSFKNVTEALLQLKAAVPTAGIIGAKQWYLIVQQAWQVFSAKVKNIQLSDKSTQNGRSFVYQESSFKEWNKFANLAEVAYARQADPIRFLEKIDQHCRFLKELGGVLVTAGKLSAQVMQLLDVSARGEGKTLDSSTALAFAGYQGNVADAFSAGASLT